MVGNDEQLGWRAKCGTFVGEKTGIHMPMGTDYWEISYLIVELSSNIPLDRIWVEQPIGIKVPRRLLHRGDS
jgi:hypothetical protein